MKSTAAWVYIMTNKPGGVLYIGFTTDLVERDKAHRRGAGSWFTKKHNCHRLVYCEPFETIAEARLREARLKAWKREWKVRLIEELNPTWADILVQGYGTTE